MRIPHRLVAHATAWIAAALITPAPGHAEVVHTPVFGDVELTVAEISCPSEPAACFFCVNDIDDPGDHRLLVGLGQRLPFVPVWGIAEGVVRPFVEIDGITIEPALLPEEAFFRSGLKWFDRFTPPACEETAPHVTYAFGSEPATTVGGDGEAVIDLPARDSSAIPFHISVCSMFVYWGSGCEISGSSTHGWRLHLPAPLEAVEIPSGDAPPIDLPAASFRLDVHSGPGGTLTATRVPTGAPEAPPFVGLDGYWDVRSTMAPRSFDADVTVTFSADDVPPDTDPEDLFIAVLSETGDEWRAFSTTIDAVTGTASARIDTAAPIVLATGVPVPVSNASWSAVKAAFR